MKTILICSILSALAVLLLPTASERPVEQEPVVLLIEQPEQSAEPEAAAAPQETGTAEVLLLTADGVQCVEEDAYLAAVVLSEMPASFEPEALAAQAVAARTFLARQRMAGKHQNADICADSACCQAWTGETGLREKYGEAYTTYVEKAAAAVQETEGEILTYQGMPIEAVYFSCSGGSTESAVAVWGTDVPYLQAVESPGEQDALRYESEVIYSEEELRSALQSAAPDADLHGSAADWFGETVNTEGGGVATITIGGVRFSGTELRTLLGLNSTKFTVDCADRGVVFHVYGFGHRVGMSQYGANAMAKLGFDYRTILQYYYRGASIKKASQAEA